MAEATAAAPLTYNDALIDSHEHRLQTLETESRSMGTITATTAQALQGIEARLQQSHQHLSEKMDIISNNVVEKIDGLAKDVQRVQTKVTKDADSWKQLVTKYFLAFITSATAAGISLLIHEIIHKAPR